MKERFPPSEAPITNKERTPPKELENETATENKEVNLSRRNFLKALAMGAAAGTPIALGVYKIGAIAIDKNLQEKLHEIEEAPEDWDYRTLEKIMTPEILDQTGYKNAQKICEILGIPEGQISAIDADARAKNLEEGIAKDRIIAEKITNKSGALQDGYLLRDQRYLLHDFQNNIELRDKMNPKLIEIFDTQIEHQQWALRHKKEDVTGDYHPWNSSYARLPGGIDTVFVGYKHTKQYQEINSNFLNKTASLADYLITEGYSNMPYGQSSESSWKGHAGNYDELVRGAVKLGFKGKFGEIDMRNTSKLSLDHEYIEGEDGNNQFILPDFPDEFYKKYYNYLKEYFPSEANTIVSWNKLKILLLQLSTADKNDSKAHAIAKEGVYNTIPQYIDINMERQPHMTMLNYAESIFSDAMSAIKLQLLAKEMVESRLEKGIIVDFEGYLHVDPKVFFVKNPVYAVYTVLKNPHFLLIEMAKKDDLPSIYGSFSPDKDMMEEMLRQIWKIALSEIDSPDEQINFETQGNLIEEFLNRNDLSYEKYKESRDTHDLHNFFTKEQIKEFYQLKQYKQTPLKKYEIPGREETFQAVLTKWRAYLELQSSSENN